jgi:hypothetical protein
VQDLVLSAALSEAVYKLTDIGPEAVPEHVDSILAELPPSARLPVTTQCSREGVPHRC